MSNPPTYPTPTARPTRLGRAVAAAARGASRRPKTTIALWLALVIGCVFAGGLAGTHSLSEAGSGVGESGHALTVLTRAGLSDPATEDVLITSADPARTMAAVSDLAARARKLPSISGIQVPSTTAGLTRAGGRSALVVVTLRGDPSESDQHVTPFVEAVAAVRGSHPGVVVREAGDGSVGHAISQTVDHGLHRVELISLPITLLILVLAFGALAAASVPLLLGITSVVAALGASGLVSHLVPNGSTTAPVVVLIGLAVGIDYSLFYIRRERAERRAGADADAALRAASTTVGRAIVVAGATVVIGLAGLLFTGFGVFTSMAAGAILVVAIAVLGSITVLPATLALLGDRIDRGRLWRRPTRARGTRTVWHRLAAAVSTHPRVSLGAALGILVALTIPVLHMQTSSSGLADLPAATPAIVAEHAIQHTFSGSPDTVQLVVTGHGLGSPAARRGLAALGRQGQRITAAGGPLQTRVAANGTAALVAIPIHDQRVIAAHRTVALLRRTLKPDTSRLIPGARGALTGEVAQDVDFTNQLSSVTPLVIAFVLTLAFILLVSTFRSVRLALSVIALNLLSVGAAFGVLTAVFQHHWAQSLLGFTSDGAVVNWLPLFAFVVLFGLSMDYTVLILERAREARQSGASARDAAAQALGETGSTVTSAALVMIAVFGTFATLPLLEFKQMGIGLAAAIALDATIVRGLALPAALTLLGDRGLAPAAAPRRRREPQWDHEARVTTLDAAHE